MQTILVLCAFLSIIFVQAGPLDVEGSVLWLDASDPDGDSTAGGEFAPTNRWVDKSAAGNAHFEQAEENRLPEIIPDGLNGLSVIRFDGSYMDVVEEGKGMLNGVSGVTMFGLLNTGAPGGGQTQRVLMISTGAGEAQSRAGLNLFDGFGTGIAGEGDFATTGRRDDGDPYQRINGGTVELDSFYQYTAVLDYENSTATLFAGGEELTTTSEFQTAGTTSATHSLNIRVGADAANNNIRGLYTGDIAELIVYNRALDQEERESIESYLRQKWLEEPPAPVNPEIKRANSVKITLKNRQAVFTLATNNFDRAAFRVRNLDGSESLNLNHGQIAQQGNKITVKFNHSGIFLYQYQSESGILNGKIVIY